MIFDFQNSKVSVFVFQILPKLMRNEMIWLLNQIEIGALLK